MRTFLSAVALSLLLAGPASGQSYEKGLQALSEADYEMALDVLRPLAEQGHTGAQYNLGLMYERGYGVAQDNAAALDWWRRGAALGDPVIQTALGDRYREGRIVPQDHAAAASWYRKAAEQGHRRAQYSLGRMYADGAGVKQDYVEAYIWFSLAAVLGGERSSESRDTTARLLTPAQFEEARRLAVVRWEEIQKRGK